MFSYVMLGAKDLEKSKQFYDAFFGALGLAPGVANGGRYFYVSDTGTFAISAGAAQGADNVGTTGFAALSEQDVNAAYTAGLAAGGTTAEDPPGWHDGGPDGRLYIAYLRDPAGNKICVLHQPA